MPKARRCSTSNSRWLNGPARSCPAVPRELPLLGGATPASSAGAVGNASSSLFRLCSTACSKVIAPASARVSSKASSPSRERTAATVHSYMEATGIVSYAATARISYRRLASATPSSHEEDPRNVRYPSKCYRVGPPPVVGGPLAGLSHFSIPAVLAQQRLRIVNAETSRGTALGEGCQKWPHRRRVEEIPVHEIQAEKAARYGQCPRHLEKLPDGVSGHIKEEALHQPYRRLPIVVASI